MKYHKNYYEILGIEASATIKDIKRAFRDLAKEYHPDTGKTRNPDIFKEIAEAYEILSDPVKRMEYDKEYFGKKGGQHGFFSKGLAKPPTRMEPSALQDTAARAPLSVPREPDLNEKRLRLKLRESIDPIQAKYDLAKFLLDTHRKPVEAERLLNDVLKNNPYNVAVAYLIGVAKCHQGELDEAEKHFRLASQLDSRHSESYVCLTCIAWKRDPNTNVSYHLSKAPDSAKGSHRYYVLFGDFLHQHRNYQNAINNLNQAVRLAPDSVKAHLLLANCLWAIGKRHEASEHFNYALSIEPDNLSVKTSQAMHSSPSGDIKLGPVGVQCPEDIEVTDKMLRIGYNRNTVTELDLRTGDVLQVDASVIEGDPVNILTMVETEFQKYARKMPYRYYSDASSLNTIHIRFAIRIPRSEIHCLVVENSGFTSGGAEPDILSSGGVVLVHLQVVVGIPGDTRKPMMESLFFGQASKGSVPESFERVMAVTPQARKRKIRFHQY